ncbi:DUF1707 domain-containing protein [Nocardiopsis gilva YIM 90087]|uniref:DUF1707 domain-containing protein n=2 Tax=Nocardiopsis gilva TaxID=280236 RepID=A0A223SDJ4_9ACTN|nr:DUF1707 domain-containing protein [Nocardiopsis gilva YIM 90087]
MRAADADRDAVAQRLASALSEGRLDLAEYERRLDTAMSATVFGELEPLTADLPTSQQPDREPVDLAAVGAENYAPSPWREWFDEWRWWLGGAIIMTGIWGVSSLRDGEFTHFWPAIPLGIWAAVLLAHLVFPSRCDDDDLDLDVDVEDREKDRHAERRRRKMRRRDHRRHR